MDYNSISQILTLRYNAHKNKKTKPLEYSDFIPSKINNVESKILEIIKYELMTQQKKLKFKHVSISLSGGIDSGLTLTMLKSILPDLKVSCFSMGFGDKNDEINRAKEIARIHNCDFHSIIKEDVISELPYLISIVKEPRWNLYQYYVLSEAKKKSNIFYSGDGGDELFGGYTFRYQKFLSSVKKNSQWKDKSKLYLSCHERDWVPDQEKMFGSRIIFSWDEIYKIFKPYFDNSLSPLDQVFLADFNGKLVHDWIPTNNAFEKYFKLKIRSVFLNSTMIKFATHIPWQIKYDPVTNKGKLPLRAILLKQKGFEKFRPIKQGFSINLFSLWENIGKEIIHTYINSDSEVVKNKIINIKWIDFALQKLHEENNELKLRYINKIFLILALEVWYKLFISKSIKKNQRL